MDKSEKVASTDVYRKITEQVLAAIERGTVPWIRPWDASGVEGALAAHRNVSSGKAYRGINMLLLWMAGRNYRSTFWGTYRQWHQLGGRVRRGEKATRVVFFRETLVEDRETGEPRRVLVLREYAVFNAEQIDCVDQAVFAPPPVPPRSRMSGRSVEIDAWFKRIGSRVKIGGTVACYMPAPDYIAMPRPDQFRSANDWYATLAHEHGHWTGHASRLDRALTGWKASPAYAFEELVAELSSAFTCTRLGIPLEKLQHAAYLASWCAGMRDHRTMIVSAASAAQRATDFLLERAGEPELEQPRGAIWVCCSKSFKLSELS